MTSSVGSLAPADIMGLTGLSATFRYSPTVITSLDLTLTGQSATSNVAAFGTASGFGIQAYLMLTQVQIRVIQMLRKQIRR